MEPTPNWTRLNTWSFAGLQRSGTAKCRGLARYPFSAPFLFYELSSVLQILFFLLLDQAMARTCVRMSKSGSVLSANVVAEHQRHSSRAIENGIARVASECRDSIASWERGPFLIPRSQSCQVEQRWRGRVLMMVRLTHRVDILIGKRGRERREASIVW